MAFTLAEMLTVAFIVGVLTVISIGSLRRTDDEFGPLYYRTYDALKTAAYNVYLDTHNDPQRDFPTTLAGSNDTGLCQRLIEYINVSGAASCNSNTISFPETDDQFKPAQKKIQFTGSNSQRFYFGPVQNTTISGVNLTWFIVYVDLNGERGPNSITAPTGRVRLADIVAFAVSSQFGEVIPMGEPIVNRKYMTAKVWYPDKLVGTKRYENRRSDSMTYFEAKRRAMGKTENIGKMYGYAGASTVEFTEKTSIRSSKIYTEYNTLLNSGLTSSIDKSKSLSAITLDKGSGSSTAATDGQDTQCMEGLVSCRVEVDSYKR